MASGGFGRFALDARRVLYDLARYGAELKAPAEHLLSALTGRAGRGLRGGQPLVNGLRLNP